MHVPVKHASGQHYAENTNATNHLSFFVYNLITY